MEQQAGEGGDDDRVETIPYLIEKLKLYRRRLAGRPWTKLFVSVRKAIREEFKKMIDQQVKGDCQMENGRQTRVEFVGRTA